MSYYHRGAAKRYHGELWGPNGHGDFVLLRQAAYEEDGQTLHKVGEDMPCCIVNYLTDREESAGVWELPQDRGRVLRLYALKEV